MTEYIVRFEKFFAEKLNELKSAVPDRLYSGMIYSLNSGGKRIRPSLFLQTYSLFSEPNESAFLFACAIEVYHTFTLVHDDLPCMDNDDFRRGKPTSHKVYGEGQAVLIGDALQSLAFSFISNSIARSSNIEAGVKAFEIFCSYTGANALIGGQSIDIEENLKFDSEMMDYIYRHKTCDLMCASCECAAALAGAGDSEMSALKNFALHYGYIFQLTDDLLDAEKNEKHSALALFSRDQIDSLLDSHKQEAVLQLAKLNGNTEFFDDLLNKTLSRRF